MKHRTCCSLCLRSSSSKLYLLWWRCLLIFSDEVNVPAMFEESDKMLTLAVLDISLCIFCRLFLLYQCIILIHNFAVYVFNVFFFVDCSFYNNVLFWSINLHLYCPMLHGHSCGCHIPIISEARIGDVIWMHEGTGKCNWIFISIMRVSHPMAFTESLALTISQVFDDCIARIGQCAYMCICCRGSLI